MLSRRRAFFLAIIVAALHADQCIVEAEPDSPEAVPISFAKDVAPILLKNCQACHSAREPKGGFQIVSYQALLKAGESGSPSLTPGKPEESEIYSLISSDDEDARMPKEADPLPAPQIDTIKRWIAEGAKFDASDPAAGLATIVPRLPQPDPPPAYRRPLPITALAFSPDGQEIAASGYHEVTIWNPATGALVRRIKNVDQRTLGLAYRPDGSLLAVAAGTPGSQGEVKLFNPADGALVKELGTMADVEFRAVFSPSGDKVAAAGADRTIRIYDVVSGKEERAIEDHADWVMALAWSPDASKLVSGSRDKTAKLYSATTGESLMTYSGHGEAVFGVAFSPDGKRVFSVGADKKIHAWNPEDGQKSAEAGGFSAPILSLAALGDKVFSASADKTLQLHKADGLQQVRVFAGAADALYAVAYHEATKRVAAAGYAGEIRVWNSEVGAPIAAFIAAPGYTAPASAQAAVK